MTIKRRVIGPSGNMEYKTFPTKSKSVESPTVKKPEPNLEVSTEEDTELEVVAEPLLNAEMIRSMEPQEIRVVAKELKVKLGNVKNKVKMQNKLIKELDLEEDVL